MSLIFITGPVRSGKSRFAMQKASERAAPVIYVATAARIAGDDEWASRIQRHRDDRPAGWKTAEAAGDASLIGEIFGAADPESTLLVDSVGTWLDDRFSRLPHDLDSSAALEALIGFGDYFIETLTAARARTIVVSEETGWGIHPEHPSGRVFRDALGFINQRLARLAQESYLVVCGYAVDLKASRPVGDTQ